MRFYHQAVEGICRCRSFYKNWS